MFTFEQQSRENVDPIAEENKSTNDDNSIVTTLHNDSDILKAVVKEEDGCTNRQTRADIDREKLVYYADCSGARENNSCGTKVAQGELAQRQIRSESIENEKQIEAKVDR